MKNLRFLVYGIRFNDSSSPLFEKMIYFHDLGMIILVYVSILMIFVIICVVKSDRFSRRFLEKKTLEIVWTIIPAGVLILFAVPSIALLYYVEDPIEREEFFGDIIKVTGHQWYWRYEYRWNSEVSYDSFMVPYNELKKGFRLLEVDKPLIIEVCVNKLIKGVTDDVIHSWACPSLGVKMDVVPGRLKRVRLISGYLGVFYGQCSEICGVKHSFMPIVVEAII